MTWLILLSGRLLHPRHHRLQHQQHKRQHPNLHVLRQPLLLQPYHFVGPVGVRLLKLCLLKTFAIFSNYKEKSLAAMGQIQQALQRHDRTVEEGFQIIIGDLRGLNNTLGLLIHQGTVSQGGSVSVPPVSLPQVPTGGDPMTQASPAPESLNRLPAGQDLWCSSAPSLAGALDPSTVALDPSPEVTFLLSIKEELRSSASNPPGPSGSSVVTRRQAKRGKGPVRRSSRSSKP